jgi:hypothetical protein
MLERSVGKHRLGVAARIVHQHVDVGGDRLGVLVSSHIGRGEGRADLLSDAPSRLLVDVGD